MLSKYATTSFGINPTDYYYFFQIFSDKVTRRSEGPIIFNRSFSIEGNIPCSISPSCSVLFPSSCRIPHCSRCYEKYLDRFTEQKMCSPYFQRDGIARRQVILKKIEIYSHLLISVLQRANKKKCFLLQVTAK